MESITKKVFVLASFFILWGFLNSVYLAETKIQSFIKLFCLENFKEEMLKANLEYDNQIAKDTCDCYLEEFLDSKNHQKSINKCKLETKKKLNL